MSRLVAIYHVRCAAREIESRADAIALEQSVELPRSAIDDPAVLADIVGRVEHIVPDGEGAFLVRIALAASTTGHEPGQLMNMLFGNTSIHEDVALIGVELPPEYVASFGGPRHGLAGLRRLVGADDRALTCSALKPQGLPPDALAKLATAMAAGGIDLIKDDHGLADQAYSPFQSRVAACAAAVEAVRRAGRGHACYLPSLSGHLDALRQQVRFARDHGLAGALVAPMVVGLPSFHALVREFPDMVFMTHPAMAGAARIAPPLLISTLFRLFGADATIFPNHGGRFGYSPAICRAVAEAARKPWHGLAAAAPVPAGGMPVDRVGEMLDFYGNDVIFLIGGSLLAARERLTEETARFVRLARGRAAA